MESKEFNTVSTQKYCSVNTLSSKQCWFLWGLYNSICVLWLGIIYTRSVLSIRFMTTLYVFRLLGPAFLLHLLSELCCLIFGAFTKVSNQFSINSLEFHQYLSTALLVNTEGRNWSTLLYTTIIPTTKIKTAKATGKYQ